MDSAEARAYAYLRSLGIGPPAHEPDGNTSPDFLIEGRIAVEVRRLNQNVVSPDGCMEGVEQVSFELGRWLYNELPKLGSSQGRSSWSVSAKWRRPLPDNKALRAEIRRALQGFMVTPMPQPTTISAHQNFELQIAPAGRDYGGFFCLATATDADRGGFVVPEALRNLHLCMSEKEKKIEEQRSRYGEWWLVLFDTLHLGLSFDNWSEIKAHVHDTHRWDKVVILSDEFPTQAVVL